MISSAVAQSSLSERYSTGGVYLGQALSELQTKEVFVVKRVRNKLFTILNTDTNDSMRVEVRDGLIAGIDFATTLYRGNELLVQPGQSKAVVLAKLGLKPSSQGDFVSFEIDENVRLLAKFDEEDGFVNGYLEKL